MSKVFTGNVLLTFSRETMEKFFFTNNNKSFKELISLFTKQDIEASVIASPNTNSNLISFDYSFGSSFQGQQALTLKFIQTNSLFELWYLSKNSTDTLSQNAIKSILNSTNSEQLNSVLESRNYAPNGNTLYFSFGVGDDIRDWAGPFTANLAKYDLSIDESGIKEITLGFTVPGNMFLRNYIESKNDLNFSDALNRYNFLLKGKNLVHRVYEKVPMKEISKVENYVVKLLDNYITGITKSPTLIVLPNLNKIYDSAFNGQPTPKDTASLEKNARDLEDQADQAEKFFKLAKQARAASPQGRPEFYSGLSEQQIKELRIKAQSIRQEISRIKANNKEASLKYGEVQRTTYKLREAFGLKVSHSNVGDDEVLVEPGGFGSEIPITIDERTEKDYNRNKDKQNVVFSLIMEADNSSIPNTTENLIDPYINLKVFGDSISKYSQEVYDQEFFVENNLRLLKLWNLRGFTNNPNLDPVYVFGDRKLIANLLYLEDVIEFSDIGNRFLSDDKYSSNIKTKIQLSYYRVDYFDTFKKGKSSSSFNEDVFIGDQLSLKSDTFRDVKRNGIPIFRYNLQNPNVMSLSIENNAAYQNVYNVGYGIKSVSPFLNVKSGRFEEFIQSFRRDKIEIIRKIREDLSQYNPEKAKFKELLDPVKRYLVENPKFTSALLRETSSVYGPIDPRKKSDTFLRDSSILTYDQLAVIVAASIVQKFSNGGPFIEVDSVEEAALLESSIVENLNRLSYNVSIKTLPFFHISTLPVGQKLALLVASENKVVGANNLGTGAFYTGLYRILGFRHFLGEGELYSEFSLMRENTSVSENTINSALVVEDLTKKDEEEFVPVKNLLEEVNSVIKVIGAFGSAPGKAGTAILDTFSEKKQ